MTISQQTQTVDVNVPRFNQAVVAALVALAFVVQSPWPVAVVAAILIAPIVFGPKASLTARVYLALVRDLVDPGGPSEVEDAAPPRFASLLGAIFTSVATAAFLLGWSATGWVLAGTVGALALLAATSRICVGCLIYQRVVQ